MNSFTASKALEIVNFSANMLTDKTGKFINHHYNDMKTIQKIVLDYNFISDKTQQEIAAYLYTIHIVIEKCGTARKFMWLAK